MKKLLLLMCIVNINAMNIAETKSRLEQAFNSGQYSEASMYCGMLAEIFAKVSKEATETSVKLEYAELAKMWGHRASVVACPNRPKTFEFFINIPCPPRKNSR